jgi:hypothetical protein
VSLHHTHLATHHSHPCTLQSTRHTSFERRQKLWVWLHSDNITQHHSTSLNIPLLTLPPDLPYLSFIYSARTTFLPRYITPASLDLLLPDTAPWLSDRFTAAHSSSSRPPCCW